MSLVPVNVKLPVRISATDFIFGPVAPPGGLMAWRTNVNAKLMSLLFIEGTSNTGKKLFKYRH